MRIYLTTKDDGVEVHDWTTARRDKPPVLVRTFEELCEAAEEIAGQYGATVDDLSVLCSSSIDEAAAGEGHPNATAIAKRLGC